MTELIIKFYNQFERIVVLTLLCMLMIVVIYATVGFLVVIGYTMIERVQSPEMHLTMPILHEVFAGFLMILIGLELMKTIVMYLDKHIVHVEVVLSVALIAIARHVIDMDLKSSPPLNLIGTGVIIFALAIGYFYFKRSSALEKEGK